VKCTEEALLIDQCNMIDLLIFVISIVF